MMAASCINHPEKEKLLILRQWQIDYCEGNHIAAGLLSILEYWHNIKYNKQQKKPAHEHHQDDLIQFHTEKDLISKMLTITRTPANIRKAVKYLEKTGAITLHRNPNERYGFDRTRHFLLHPDVINQWLESYEGDMGETIDTSLLQRKRSTKSKEELVERHIGSVRCDITGEFTDNIVELEPIEEDKPVEVSSEIIIEAILSELTIDERHKAINILDNLQDNALYRDVLEEWKWALLKGKVKNKFSYLAGLINRANRGKFQSTVPAAEKAAGVVQIPDDIPEPKAPHDVFPPYPQWKEKQAQIAELFDHTDYVNFILPVRAYLSDKEIFLRCPNVYSHQFLLKNINKIGELLEYEWAMYLG